MPKKIVIVVNTDGSVKHDFIGYAGQECMAADEALRAQLAALGITIENTRFEPKPELLHGQETYRPQPSGQQQKEGA
jgi:hypothetical protein